MKVSITESQMEKIKYECMLLRKTPEQLYVLAPQMFTPIKKETPPINPDTEDVNKDYPNEEDFDDFATI